MNFADMLSIMIKVSDCKMKEIAEYLNYDISYLSKLANNKILPNKKGYLDVIEDMSKYFSRRIYLSGMEYKIVELVGRKIVIDTHGRLEAIIHSLLEDAYYRSLYYNKDEDCLDSKITTVDVEKEKMIDRIAVHIKKYIAFSENDLTIYCTFNDLTLIKEILTRFKSFFLIKNIKINLKCIIGESVMNLDEKINMIGEEFCSIVGNILFFNLEIYIGKETMSHGMIYIKNHSVINYCLNINKKPIALFKSSEPHLLEEYDLICEHMFRECKSIMKSRDKYYFEERMIGCFMPSTKKTFITYLSYLEGFSISSDFLEKIMKRRNIKGLEANMLRLLRSSYENILKNSKVYLNISKKGIYRSFKRKEVIIGDVVFSLTDEEYEEYVAGVKELLLKRENIQISLIEDKLFIMPIYELGIGIFISDDYIFLKENPLYVEKDRNGYFEIIDSSYSAKVFEIAKESLNKEVLVRLEVSVLDYYANYQWK